MITRRVERDASAVVSTPSVYRRFVSLTTTMDRIVTFSLAGTLDCKNCKTLYLRI